MASKTFSFLKHKKQVAFVKCRNRETVEVLLAELGARVQERALRAVNDNKTAKYEQLLSQAKLTSLVSRRIQDILILMYKVKNSLAPENIRGIFCKQFKIYNLRSSDFLFLDKYVKHGISYLGPYLWGKNGQRPSQQKKLS